MHRDLQKLLLPLELVQPQALQQELYLPLLPLLLVVQLELLLQALVC
jgi:hypothetical protein